MKSSHTLTVHAREKQGSRYARRERAAGRLPAVLYGHGAAPMSISLDARQALRYFHAGEKVFTLDVPGETKQQTVILKDLQFDYLGTNVVHVDLARVDLNEEIEANVHLRFVGDALGLKKANTILTHPTVNLHIRCTVATLPDHIDVSIVSLDEGQAIHAREVVLPPGVALLTDADAVVAAISTVKEQVETGEATAVEGQPAQPEVITEKKKEEGADKAEKKG
ncbi:MAG TPA: 50S ribosomal protein L25 [Phycisphaerales bacterium]|nr:50S ribosomal protein L25 [Phycisphaerales bacterium]